MLFSELKKGQTVRFAYTGGTRAGAHRLVQVDEIEGNNLYGYDRELGNDQTAYRHYLLSRITGKVELVADVNQCIVFPKEFLTAEHAAKTSILAATSIYRLLNPDINNVSYSTEAGVIVVPRTDLPRIEVIIDSKEVCVSLHDHLGKVRGFCLKHNKSGLAEQKFSSVLTPAEFTSVTDNFAGKAWGQTVVNDDISNPPLPTKKANSQSWENMLLGHVGSP